jgi:hypothetical protein
MEPFVFQTPWGCRWSRLSDPEPCAKHPRTPVRWVCVRPTLHLSSRLVGVGECAACPYFESIEFGRMVKKAKIHASRVRHGVRLPSSGSRA